jgi:hypothetical protein
MDFARGWIRFQRCVSPHLPVRRPGAPERSENERECRPRRYQLFESLLGKTHGTSGGDKVYR